jgi:hypothetical protein
MAENIMKNYNFGGLSDEFSLKNPVKSPKSRKIQQQINLIDDYGLTAESLQTFKPHLGQGRFRNKNTVKLAELWGAKSSQNLLIRSKLTKAAEIFKFECWKNGRKIIKLKGSPVLPHRIDRLLGSASPVSSNFESKKVFRVYSPQLELKKEAQKSRAGRVETIDEIIKNCNEFRANISRDLKVENFCRDLNRRKLTKNEKMNIKNIIRNLDQGCCE